RGRNKTQVARLALNSVLSRLVDFRLEQEPGNDAFADRRFGERFNRRVGPFKLRKIVKLRPLDGEREGVVGQSWCIVTSAAPSRAEVGVLERQIGAKEDVKPQQGIRVGRRIASAAGVNPLRARP